MIRINLLPVKAAQRRASGLRQMLVGSVVALLALTGVVALHAVAMTQLAAQKAQIALLQESIKKLKAQVGDYEQIKQQRESLLRQKDAIQKLQAARSGPASLMRELSDILTRGKGPSIDREKYDKRLLADPNAGFNPNWEPRRAWLIGYAEKDRVATIKGGAKSDEDVAEFLKRMKLSEFFTEVFWKQTQPQVDPRLNGATFVIFDVTARVAY